MNKNKNFVNTDLSRIVKLVLKEQVTQTTTTIPTTSTVQNSQQSTGTTNPSTTATTNPSTTTTTTTPPPNTGDTQTEPVSFGTDNNAVEINKRVKKGFLQKIKNVFNRGSNKQAPTNEEFNLSLMEEMNKMSFLLNYERGVVISEQKVKKNLFESDGSEEEKPPFNAPIVVVKKLNNTEWRVFAFGTFPVNVTTGPLATQFMNRIVEEVYKDPILSDPQYKGRVVMTVAHVFGGASNYNNGPVVPDMDAKLQGNGSVTYTQSKPVTDESQFTGNHDLNTSLAKNRATNLFRLIKTQLPVRTQNSIKIKVKEEIKGYNVNTGGVVDKDRNSRLYPVPGQHVNMALIIKIKPKAPNKVASVECMKSLKITIASTPHQCDTAAFDVKLNGVILGSCDLGNNIVGTSAKDSLGRSRPIQFSSKTDGAKGGKRWKDFIINASNAASFVTSADGSVKITMKGRDSKYYEDRFGLGSDQSYRGQITSHADVPYVKIQKADGTLIYNQAPTPNTYAFGGRRESCGTDSNPCQEFELIKFNPCATNVIDGDLTGF
jgi:hypothetical protein